MTVISKIAAPLGVIAATLGVVTAIAGKRFADRMDALDEHLVDAQSLVEKRRDLPLEVAALAARLGADAEHPSRYVAFRQTGTMWLKPGGAPQRFTASQRIGTTRSGFVWRGRIGAFGRIAVVDAFVDGQGHLEARLFGSLRVAKMNDTPAINQGEMLRYLVELPLNPDAILFDHALEWVVVDPQTIKVSAGTGDDRGEITFGLDDDGMIVTGQAASRTFDVATGQRYPWHGRLWDYQRVSGRLLPMRAEVAWVIDGVSQVYWRGQMIEWQAISAADAAK